MKKFYANAQFFISITLFPGIAIFFIYSVGAAILHGEWKLLLIAAVSLFIVSFAQIFLGLLSEA